VGVSLVPVPEVSGDFQGEMNKIAGREIQVTGAFFSATSNDGRSVGQLLFWSFIGPPEELTKSARDKAPLLTLEALVSQPDRREGQLVRVVGQFRGRNLFGDLPVRSQVDGDDWVLKDDLYAVWITDKKPKGDGFQLDGGLKRDTGKWIEVIGRVRVAGSVVYIRAAELRLAAPPSATAMALPTPPPPPPPPRPPEIVFSLPLDGEREVLPDGTFTVQFSKDMDSRSFAGRVQFRYAGPVQPGDRGFQAARWAYDEGKRALTIVPGDRLAAGRTIELVFLQGIVDAEGMPLSARPGRFFEGVVEVLRWQARATF